MNPYTNIKPHELEAISQKLWDDIVLWQTILGMAPFVESWEKLTDIQRHAIRLSLEAALSDETVRKVVLAKKPVPCAL